MKKSQFNRGFPQNEFESRCQKASQLMKEKNLDCILLTTEALIRYFTGFLSQFWQSPTRPWFVILQRTGKPIAVIPSIGKEAFLDCYVEEVLTWDSPNPNDDGLSLLTKTLKKFKNIGTPLGQESFVRMPYKNFCQLQENLENSKFKDISGDLHKIRSIKSQLEIEKISEVCKIVNNAFDLLPRHVKVGQSERHICREMTVNLLHNGADAVPYLICGSGPGGYDSIIMGPSDKIISEGDILIIDTGTTLDGYYSDFCRNIAFGSISKKAKEANKVLTDSIDAAFEIAKPGVTTTDLFNKMWSILKAGGALGNNIGRMGHGLGTELTEWPSHNIHDKTPLEEGMVITLEPGMFYEEGKSLVHEENLVITNDGAQWLSRRAPRDIPIIEL